MDNIRCSFCGKHRSRVRKLISGPNVYICDECVALCNQVIEQEEGLGGVRYPRPLEIYDELNKYVVGQDRAKRVLSVAVYQHYKRISARAQAGDVELAKGNVMLLGPTGCGKTLLVQALARKLDVPLAMTDATTLTEAGYVGEDVESVVKTLYRSANGDAGQALRGIVCIDEVDKLARRASGPSVGRDVSGEGVQQGLLKLLEGRQCTLTPDGGRGHGHQEPVQLDTTNILFIITGAFNGIEEIVQTRIGEQGMGFGARVDKKREDKDALRAKAQHEDLIKFGMIPEFMGRIPVVVSCDELSADALAEILWRPKNALIRQYERLLEMDGVKLTIGDEAMRAMAEAALRRRSGARGLRAIFEEVMLDAMYDIPSLDNVTECIVDEKAVRGGVRPKLIRQEKAAS